MFDGGPYGIMQFIYNIYDTLYYMQTTGLRHLDGSNASTHAIGIHILNVIS